ncbi:MAG: hypothetical protein ACON49_09095 [Candidatus Puniceispirillaceae bacterium]
MGAFKAKSIATTEPVNPTVLADLEKEGLAVFCWCNRCGHNAEVGLSVFIRRFGAQYPVPELGRSMRCKKCHANDIATRPAWPSYGGQMARHQS